MKQSSPEQPERLKPTKLAIASPNDERIAAVNDGSDHRPYAYEPFVASSMIDPNPDHDLTATRVRPVREEVRRAPLERTCSLLAADRSIQSLADTRNSSEIASANE